MFVYVLLFHIFPECIGLLYVPQLTWISERVCHSLCVVYPIPTQADTSIFHNITPHIEGCLYSRYSLLISHLVGYFQWKQAQLAFNLICTYLYCVFTLLLAHFSRGGLFTLRWRYRSSTGSSPSSSAPWSPKFNFSSKNTFFQLRHSKSVFSSCFFFFKFQLVWSYFYGKPPVNQIKFSSCQCISELSDPH